MNQTIVLMLLLITTVSLASCKFEMAYNMLCCKCSPEEIELLKSTRAGDSESLKTYLANGGDPQMECFDPIKGNGFGMFVNLSDAIADSESNESVVAYLETDPPQRVLNGFLNYFCARGNQGLTRMLINRGGMHFRLGKVCADFSSDQVVKEYSLLSQLGYDFNHLDASGNNILILHAMCEPEESTEDLVSTLKFLIDNGARTDIKNNNGKTAYDLAVNPKVKEFLAQYR